MTRSSTSWCLTACLLLAWTTLGLSPAVGERQATANELAAATGEQVEELQRRLSQSALEIVQRAAGRGAWSSAELDALVEELLLDSARLELDPVFKDRLLPIIATAMPSTAPSALRDPLLARLSTTPGLGLFDLEAIEEGWGTVLRTSSTRRAEVADGEIDWELGHAFLDAPIAASVYSLPGGLVPLAEAEALLRSVRRWAPDRWLLVLADYPLSRDLTALAAELGLDLVRTWGRGYSPWPRDPMSVLWGNELGRVLALRPNRQATRELDSAMGLELIQELPAALDERLGGLRWAVAPIPFHNGNMLATPDATWISLHTLEPRILEILGLDRVPVERFTTRIGVSSYLRAASRAARELEAVFGNPVKYVHSLPHTTQSPVRLQMEMRRIGGGAGFDLDSAVTVLPRASGPAALVGQPSLGAQLVRRIPAEELARFGEAYRLAPSGPELAERLAATQDTPRPRGLEGFLDLVAAHLTEMGMEVRRTPLLLVPTSLLSAADAYPDPHFLIGWNNVVLDAAGDERRAEGFASMLATGDREMQAQFAELGYELELLPPLVESVLRNGGYRCASNHIRDSI